MSQQNEMRRKNLQELSSPAKLDARVRQLNLGLVAASPQQRVFLSEAPLKPVPDTNRSFAAAISER